MPLGHSQTPLAGLTINITIHEGKDLIAKDKNWRGVKTGSDPFVRIYVAGLKMGYTETAVKTCDPAYNQSFEYKLGAETTARIQAMRHHDEEKQKNENDGDFVATATLEFRIFDKDRISFNDPMGTVAIPLSSITFESAQPTWYPVGKGHGSEFCENATGELRVSVRVTAHKYLTIPVGHTHALETETVHCELLWDTVNKGGGPGLQRARDLDVAAVAVNRNGQVQLPDCVYWGNLYNRGYSVRHSGDDLTGCGPGTDERITCQLKELPAQIVALYFVLSIAASEQTLASVAAAEVRLVDATTGFGICRYTQTDFGFHTSMYLLRLSRDAANPTRWIIAPMGQGDAYAHDFGFLIPRTVAYTRDLVPRAVIDPFARQAILRKDGAIRLRDYVARFPAYVTFGLKWDAKAPLPPSQLPDDKDAVGAEPREPDHIDLDASAICLDHSFNLVEIVSSRHLRRMGGAICHGGDEREGDVLYGDDEKMTVYLQEVESRIEYIVFVVNSKNGVTLDDVKSASCRLYTSGNDGKDLAVYQMDRAAHSLAYPALLMGALYRGESRHPDDWNFRIISETANGTSARENVDEAQRFLRNNPAFIPRDLPEPSVDDLKQFEMPHAEPIHVDEEDIFVPYGTVA